MIDKASESPPTTPSPDETRRLLRRSERSASRVPPRSYYPLTRNTSHTQSMLPHVCSPRGSERSQVFLPILILFSSDIKTNPVPSFPCPTCSRPYNIRGGLNPMQCSQCSSWTHYNIRCSGLLQRHHIPPGWVCYRCYPLHNMAPQAAPHSPGSTSSQLPLMPAHHNRPAASHTLPLGPTPSFTPPIPSSSPTPLHSPRPSSSTTSQPSQPTTPIPTTPHPTQQ